MRQPWYQYNNNNNGKSILENRDENKHAASLCDICIFGLEVSSSFSVFATPSKSLILINRTKNKNEK